MTDPVAKTSILATLLADLKSIEDNFHGLADPQLAIGGKMREILTETVRIVETGDFSAIVAKVEGALEQLSAGVKKAEELGAKLEAGLAKLQELAKRVEAIEAHPAVSIPPLQPAASGGEGDAGASASASGVGTSS